MPKKTFLNLKEEKRREITHAFLREFALKTFDEASITTVVKKLGIAKGSIYQYFDDKLDLFTFLIDESSAVKTEYIGGVERNDFPDFWAYFKALYQYGFQFDAENPLQSHFLHNLENSLNSPSIKWLYRKMLDQVVQAFENMAKNEVKLGLFRDDISTTTMGFMLYQTGISIREQLEYSGVIKPQESIRANKPVYQDKKEKLMEVVNESILLMRPAFDKQNSKK